MTGHINKTMYEGGIQDDLYRLHSRLELPRNHVEQALEQSQSIGCLVSKKKLNPRRNSHEKVFVIASSAILALGAQEPFRYQRILGYGTAFLISPRYAFTAAHCFLDEETNQLDHERIKKTRLVFDFKMLNSNEDNKEFPKKDVYKIRLVDYHYARPATDGRWADWALIELKREVEGDRPPLKTDFSDRLLAIHTPVYMLGHSNGNPMRYIGEAKTTKKVKSKEKNLDYFECSLSGYKGNSGSPVFEKNSGCVIGIYCTGNLDFDVIEGYGLKNHEVTQGEIDLYGRELCQTLAGISFVKNFPSLQMDANQIGMGLNLHSRCKKRGCPSYNQVFLKAIGLGIHDMAKEIFLSKCPRGHKKEKEVEAFAFLNCQYKIDAKRKNKKSIIRKGQTLQGETISFAEFGKQKWSYIQITTKKI